MFFSLLLFSVSKLPKSRDPMVEIDEVNGSECEAKNRFHLPRPFFSVYFAYFPLKTVFSVECWKILKCIFQEQYCIFHITEQTIVMYDIGNGWAYTLSSLRCDFVLLAKHLLILVLLCCLTLPFRSFDLPLLLCGTFCLKIRTDAANVWSEWANGRMTSKRDKIARQRKKTLYYKLFISAHVLRQDLSGYNIFFFCFIWTEVFALLFKKSFVKRLVFFCSHFCLFRENMYIQSDFDSLSDALVCLFHFYGS